MSREATCVYIGYPDRHVLIEDGEGPPMRLSPYHSQKLVNHSPDGFNWGYGGSGPSQLALAILLDYLETPELALANYQQFKWDIVAHLPSGMPWKLTGDEIEDWI